MDTPESIALLGGGVILVLSIADWLTTRAILARHGGVERKGALQ